MWISRARGEAADLNLGSCDFLRAEGCRCEFLRGGLQM